MLELLTTRAGNAQAALLLAHGAGAAMTSPFLARLAESLAEQGVTVARFNFGYMAARASGVRRPPPRAETLSGEYHAAFATFEATFAGLPLLIGGKSMGGRVASLIAEALWHEGRIRGLACLGYPFHPPKKPEQLRTAHLAGLTVPTLILQGTRDPFGTPEEVAAYALAPAIEVDWVEGGNHDLKPPRSPIPFDEIARRIAAFAQGRGEAAKGNALSPSRRKPPRRGT